MAADRRSDGRLLDTLPWTLAALAIAIAPHAMSLPPWIPLLAVACGLWRWIVELRRALLPWRGLRIALAFGGFVSVLFAYGGINGVGPGTALLVIMAALKLLETRDRRDQFVLLFIALFLVLAAFLREQYIWSLPYLIAAAFLIVTAWLNAARLGDALPARAVTGTAGRLLVQALPLMLLFWVLFPRVPGPFWAIPSEDAGGITGLSDRMSPGDITRLGQSNALAFRVWFDGEAPPPHQRYWRGIVMDQVLNGRTWAARSLAYDALAGRKVTPEGPAIQYRIRLEPTGDRYLFTLETAARWAAPSAFMTSRLELGRTLPVDERIAYEAVSYPAALLEPELSAVARRYLTRLPEDSNPRTRALAEEMWSRSADEEDFIRRVLEFYREEAFFYTLSPPSLGRNAADDFLFETRRGFCEHYATSFATIMRSAGIPARTVAGYQGGEHNPMGDYFVLRQSDAHAWVEVWLEGSGWRRVDPTAAVAPERIESGLYDALDNAERAVADRFWRLDLAETVRFYWDFANARWDEWVLGYGPSTQVDFMRWLGMERPGWRRMMTWLVVLMTAMLTALGLWLAWTRRRPRPDRASRLYRRFVAATGLPRQPAEPPLGYAARVTRALPALSVEIRRITGLYLDSRYAGLPREAELEAAVRGFASRSRAGAGHPPGTATRRRR